jgi:hypothetical protein
MQSFTNKLAKKRRYWDATHSNTTGDICLTFLVVNERYRGSERRVMARQTSKMDGKGDTGTKGIKVRKNVGEG